MQKKKKFRPLKCINGVRGAIALFMAVLMTPFLTILMMLVEVGRYNSAVSVLDEALGVSAVSTLANYDSYLQDRWGVLALSQDVGSGTTVFDTINENVGVMGDSLSLKSTTFSGEYSLADSEILYSQIMEFSKLNSPTMLATNFLNISDLIDSLEELKDVDKILNIITSGVTAVDSTITLVEAADELKKAADELDKLISKYESTYTAFEMAANDLIDALAESKPSEKVEDMDALTEDEKAQIQEEDRLYDENIKNLRKNVDTKKLEYVEVLNSIIDNLTAFKDKMKSCTEALVSIKNSITGAITKVAELSGDLAVKQKDLEALNEEIERMESEGYTESTDAYRHALDYRAALEKEVAELSAQVGIESAAQKGLSTVVDGWQGSFATYSDETIGAVVEGFKGLKVKVNNVDSSRITKNTTKVNRSEYKSVSVSGYISADDIQAYLDSQEDELAKGCLSDLIKGIKTFLNTILNTKGFFDPELSAYIDVNYYKENFGGLPGGGAAGGGVMAVVEDIGDIITDINDFAKSLTSWKFITALKKLKSLISNIGELIKDLAQFAVDICRNIYDLLTTYDRIYYSTYTAFNLPCRTDCKSGSLSFETMSGYKMGENSLPSQNIISTPGVGFDDLAALIDMIRSCAKKTGDDLVFSGAELEYVLYGSNSEVANQLYTFVALYLVRLLSNIPAILANAEVQALATASTFGYPVVIFLEIIAEPLADAILLVNGGAVSFYKTTIYLTPTGLPQLLAELVKICKLTTDEKEAIKSDLVDAFGATDDDYDYQRKLIEYEEKDAKDKSTPQYLKNLMKFNYREYCFLILLLTVTKEQQIARISNLMQMEGVYYYKQKNASYVFDLKKSYTYISLEADVTIKQMLPSLADSSHFRVSRHIYRGY